MARPRKGSAWEHGKPGTPGYHWDIRITLSDGSRGVPICLHDVKDEKTARERALRHTARAERDGVTRAKSETGVAGTRVPTWADLWIKDRERRGLDVKSDRGRWKKWIAPVLGDLPMALVSRADIERIVASLDEAILDERIAWKTATNVWTLVTTAFLDAKESKVLTLRVREDNPAASVRGPETGNKKGKTYLHPAEFLKLASCEKVPLYYRRLVAFAAYTGMRRAEIRGLRWPDVDLEAGTIEVHRTEDDRGEIDTCKNDTTRKIPIEPALRPLLDALKAEASDDRVIYMPDPSELAIDLRFYLKEAGCARERLYTNDATRIHLRFHDLKGTAATWWIIQGVDPVKVMYRVAHGDFETTKLYVSEAENTSFKPEDVFPPLPQCLLVSSGESSERRPRYYKNAKRHTKAWSTVRESNPGQRKKKAVLPQALDSIEPSESIQNLQNPIVSSSLDETLRRLTEARAALRVA